MEEVFKLSQILWDYLQLHRTPEKADCIVGFGCYNEDVARRAAQLYRQGYAPKVLFTGGLGRNTAKMWTESEAVRFAHIAVAEGVPEKDILLETASTNTAENILFTQKRLAENGIVPKRILGVHKPYMQRRIASAWPVYWPGVEFFITSWEQTMPEYMAGVSRWGRTAEDTVHMLVGDFQRIDLYARKGYQLPQQIPETAQRAFEALCAAGYTQQLVR